jgi:hypothetical protein
MDQVDEIPQDFVQFKNEQCIQIRFREGLRDNRVVLTNPVSTPKVTIPFSKYSYFYLQ